MLMDLRHNIIWQSGINTIYNNFSHYNAATISNYSWSFNYEHDKHKLELAKKFIKSLVPSKQVAELMPWFSKHTTGYHLRLLHPRTVTKKIINSFKNKGVT